MAKSPTAAVRDFFMTASKPEWLGMLESSLKEKPKENVYALATVGDDGAPKVRHVVNRTITPSGLLLATTDIRTPKAHQLSPGVEAAWLFPSPLIQFRITAKAYVLPASKDEHSRSLSRHSSVRSLSRANSRQGSRQGSRSQSQSRTPSISTPALSPAASFSGPSGLHPASAGGSPHESPGLVETPGAETPKGVDEAADALAALSFPSGAPPPSAVSPAGSQYDADKPDPALSNTPAHPSLPTLQIPSRHLSKVNDDAASPSSPRHTNTLESILSAFVRDGGVNPTSPESSPSWWEAERKRLWESMGRELRASFVRPVPGTNLEEEGGQEGAEGWVKELSAQATNDDEARLIAAAQSNFAILALVPERVEVLELRASPHRRTVWSKKFGSWEKEEIVP